ncbi:MAG: xanthine dehydrogenase family protein molybdopterin-binding subunit [Chloroflexota bacterium]
MTSVRASRATRLDALDKTTGTARYASDLALPGMLVGMIVRSDRPHARIRSIDMSAAESLPGVAAIVSSADAPGAYGEVIKDQNAFAVDRVRYIGEPIAAIAADSAATARSAAELIRVEYEELPAVFDPLSALEADAPLIHPDAARYAAPSVLARKGNLCSRVTLNMGDIEAGFREAVRVFEDEYVTHSVHQTPMETRAVVADVDAYGRVTLYASTQHPFGVRAQIAEALRLPLTDIRVVTPHIGGGFGSKLEASVELYAALLARKARRPIRLVNSRDEDLLTGNPRHPMTIRLKSGLDAAGQLVARQVKVVMDAGAYAVGSPVLTGVAANLATGPYRIPHVHVEVVAAYTNNIPFSAFRGPTGPQMVFAVESHTDALARRLGSDPLDFRVRHVFKNGDRAANGQVLQGVSLTDVLERAAQAIGWRTAREPTSDGLLRGKGLSCCWWTTTAGAAACSIKMNEDGSVVVQTGATEIGTGAVTAGIAQIVAGELGLQLDRIRLVSGDTEATPYDAGAQGSRTLFNMGAAARDAAVQVRAQLVQRAAEVLEAHVDDLEIGDGDVYVRGSRNRAVSYAALMAGAMWITGAIATTGSYMATPTEYEPQQVQGSLYPTFNSPSFHCHAAEVSVEPDTGLVKVTGFAAAQDVGFAVNPTYIEGQIQGGAAQGIGYALLEELHFEDGRILNPNLALYKLPSTLDVPNIQAIIVEEPSEQGPYGTKGVGEPPVVASAAAVANAVFDATGVQLSRTPLTPERVLRSLHPEMTDA